MSDVTQILQQIDAGDSSAAEKLLPLVYGELRKLAASRMAAESPDHTLQATALVHEAYLRLVGGNEAQQWNGRGHFFGAAAEAMRRILVDQARAKAGLKGGGLWQRLRLSQIELTVPETRLDFIALDDALNQLESKDPRSAALVKLRFFAGLTMPEAAKTLGVSLATAKTDWAYAKSWLLLRISDGEPGQRFQKSPGES